MDKPPPLVPRDLRLPVPERIGGARTGGDRRSTKSALVEVAKTLAREEVDQCRHRFSAFLCQSGARAARPRGPRKAPARSVDHAFERGLPGDAGIRALVHRLRQCLCAAADGPLSAAASTTRLRGRGIGCPLFLITSAGGLTTVETARRLPDPACRIRPGRWRHPGGADRRTMRLRSISSRSTWAAPPQRSA